MCGDEASGRKRFYAAGENNSIPQSRHFTYDRCIAFSAEPTHLNSKLVFPASERAGRSAYIAAGQDLSDCVHYQANNNDDITEREMWEAYRKNPERLQRKQQEKRKRQNENGVHYFQTRVKAVASYSFDNAGSFEEFVKEFEHRVSDLHRLAEAPNLPEEYKTAFFLNALRERFSQWIAIQSSIYNICGIGKGKPVLSYESIKSAAGNEWERLSKVGTTPVENHSYAGFRGNGGHGGHRNGGNSRRKRPFSEYS